jgi:hypothetical protein
MESPTGTVVRTVFLEIVRMPCKPFQVQAQQTAIIRIVLMALGAVWRLPRLVVALLLRMVVQIATLITVRNLAILVGISMVTSLKYLLTLDL